MIPALILLWLAYVLNALLWCVIVVGVLAMVTAVAWVFREAWVLDGEIEEGRRHGDHGWEGQE